MRPFFVLRRLLRLTALSPLRRISAKISLVIIISGLLFANGGLAFGQTGGPVQPTPVSLAGIFSIKWGDPQPGSGLKSSVSYSLTEASGKRYQLALDPRLGERVLSIDNKPIKLDGTLTTTRVAGIDINTVSVQNVQLDTSAGAKISPNVIGNQPFISLMCKYADVPALEPQPLAFFTTQLSNTKPGFNHYIREMSYDAANLDNSTASGWHTLPKTYAEYGALPGGFGGSGSDQIALDCGNASGLTNLDNYFGINFMLNGDLGGSAFGGSTGTITLGGKTKNWRATWMPYSGANSTFGWAEHGILAHEISHAFGSPHSGGSLGYEYSSSWDVVSNPQANCNLATDPTYGCLGQGSVAYNKDSMGFIPAARKLTYDRTGGSQTFTLDSLSEQTPTDANSKYMIIVPSIATPATRFYTVEARKQQGYDVKLPTVDAIIIEDVDTTRTGANVAVAWLFPPPGAALDALRQPQGGPNQTGDAAGKWALGTTLTDPTNQITINVTAQTAKGFTVTIAPTNIPSATVTQGTDDGTGGTNNSLSFHLANAANNTVITFDANAMGGTTVLMSSSYAAPVNTGLVIDGGSCAAGPRITIQATGLAATDPTKNGITLSKGLKLKNIKVAGFGGKQINALTTGNLAANLLGPCVVASKQ